MTERWNRWSFENYDRGNFHRGEMVDGWPIAAKAPRHSLGDFRRAVTISAVAWHINQFAVPRGSAWS